MHFEESSVCPLLSFFFVDGPTPSIYVFDDDFSMHFGEHCAVLLLNSWKHVTVSFLRSFCLAAKQIDSRNLYDAEHNICLILFEYWWRNVKARVCWIECVRSQPYHSAINKEEFRNSITYILRIYNIHVKNTHIRLCLLSNSYRSST